MPKPLERSYDGIIIGAGHHGLILGTYLAQGRARHPLVERRLTLRRRAVDPGSDRARLLSQPPFDQSFPHQRDALVQGPRPRRQGHLHHAALRVRPGASRRHRAGARPRPRGDGRQHRALLGARRRDLPRVEPRAPRRSRRRSAARALLRAAAAARARGAAVAHRHGARLPRRHAPPAARPGARSCSRTSTCGS